MKHSRSVAAIALIFAAVQLMAIAFMSIALTEEDQVFEDPGDPMIAVFYLFLLLGFTLLFLLLMRFNLDKLLKGIFYFCIGFVIFFVASALSGVLIADAYIILLVGAAFGVIAVIALWRKPEWYVLDSVGLTMSVGIIALLGISLRPLPILILLIALAVYDAISVYKTKHMLKLADGVIDMGVPLLLVIPKKLPYSFSESKPNVSAEKATERDAFFVGLGDLIIPGLLSASAFWSIDGAIEVFGLPADLLVALGTIIGSVIGLVVLMRIVLKGKPQAGLPILSTAAILAFFVSYLLVLGFDFTYIIGG